jgi:hypothetical protein
MKRDLDLMRKMLLRIEEKGGVPPSTLSIEDFLDLCDQPYVLSLHIDLLRDAGFIEAVGPSYDGDMRDYDIIRITLQGYEYLEAVRNARIWKSVKDKIAVIGGATLDIVKALAVEQAKDILHMRG